MSARLCPYCGLSLAVPGFTVETEIATGYGHACGGDEQACQQLCPVPEPIEVELAVACPNPEHAD